MARPRTSKTSDTDLDVAFAKNQFEAFYQPQIDVMTGTVVCAESVARWRHPRLGVLRPSLFIDHLRQNNRYLDFSKAMMARAIKECANWRKGKGKIDISVSINVTGKDVIAPGFVAFLSECLKTSRLPASCLTLEIPELELAGADREAISVGLLAARTLGCGIAMEARGPIYNPQDGSNLPLTQLKIGGAAILRFASAFQDARIGIVHRRLEWARNLGLETVAVGAESSSALRALVALGFDRVQCNYLSPAADRKFLAGSTQTDFKFRIDAAANGYDVATKRDASIAASKVFAPAYLPPRRSFGSGALSIKSVDME